MPIATDTLPLPEADEARTLAVGLKALGVLIERGALDVDGLARAANVQAGQAAALLVLFQGCGLVLPSADGQSFVATVQAQDLIGTPGQIASPSLH